MAKISTSRILLIAIIILLTALFFWVLKNNSGSKLDRFEITMLAPLGNWVELGESGISEIRNFATIQYNDSDITDILIFESGKVWEIERNKDNLFKDLGQVMADYGWFSKVENEEYSIIGTSSGGPDGAVNGYVKTDGNRVATMVIQEENLGTGENYIGKKYLIFVSDFISIPSM